MYVNLNGDCRRASNQANTSQVIKVNMANARPVIGAFGAVLLGVAMACTPTLSYAQHSSGGGHVGGGGHFSGGHSAGRSGGGRVAAGGRGYAGGARYATAHYAGGAYGAHGGYTAARGGYAGRAGFAGAHAAWGGGAHYWGGGYWGGRFWPHAYFYPGYAWFLPFLPLGYATFWWGGMPYYYADNLYYTWNPGYNGYTVTDPPPVAGSDAGDASGDAAGDAAPSNPAAAGPQYGAQSGAGAADVYVYPRNGQNEQQTSNDRYECHSWAVNQTGFDPTRAAQQSGNPADYRRAMIACLDARGYTAR
jgi:hypothetical protein